MYSLAQVLNPLSRKKCHVGASSRSRGVNYPISQLQIHILTYFKMIGWIGWIGKKAQCHTASAARASAARVTAAITTAARASAATAAAHYVQRMKGGRFRRGGCVCVSGDEQEKNGSYFKSMFNPTIQPSN